MSKSLLTVEDLHVSVAGKPILKGVNLEIRQGEIHALMGPNGSGKSTLAYALVGHPRYEITSGKVTVDDTDVWNSMPTNALAWDCSWRFNIR